MPADQTMPFFIVGAQRSGTTMLRLMLNSHSRLCVPFESVFIPEFYKKLECYGDLNLPDNSRALAEAVAAHPFVIKGQLMPNLQEILDKKPTTYPAMIDAIFSSLAAARGKVRWGDKTPSYIVEMDVLWKIFPECRFVHLIRDGRDVALSLRSLSWGTRDLIRSAQNWCWKVALGRKMGQMIPQHYLEVRYEDLVTNPSEILTRICNFLGENFEVAMLHYPETAIAEMPAKSLQWHRMSVVAPDARKIGAWRAKMSQDDQIIFDDVAGSMLEECGYQRVKRKHTLTSRIRLAQYALLGRAWGQ